MFEKIFMQIKIVIMILLQQIMCNASVISTVQKWKHAAGALCCVCLTPRGRRGLRGDGCRPPCPSLGPDKPEHTHKHTVMIDNV